MSEKITWHEIYKDFRRRHPNMRTHVRHWYPCGFLTIKIFFDDGTKGSFNYFDHRMHFIVDEA